MKHTIDFKKFKSKVIKKIDILNQQRDSAKNKGNMSYYINYSNQLKGIDFVMELLSKEIKVNRF